MEKTIKGFRELRRMLVRDLTPEQCRKLLSHNHGQALDPMRRKAYLLKSAGENWTAYFSDATIASRIQQWIENEKTCPKCQFACCECIGNDRMIADARAELQSLWVQTL